MKYILWATGSGQNKTETYPIKIYKSEETGELVELKDCGKIYEFEKNNEIITKEEYKRLENIKRSRKGRVKKSLVNRNIQEIENLYGVSMDDILERCKLIHFPTDEYVIGDGYSREELYWLNDNFKAFPSRIFELLTLIEPYVEALSEPRRQSIKNIIDYAKIKGANFIFRVINTKVSLNPNEDIRVEYETLTAYNKQMGLNFEARRESALDFLSKNPVVDASLIEDLERGRSSLVDRNLYSLFKRYNTKDDAERIYPIYEGNDPIECASFELIQYDHYLKWALPVLEKQLNDKSNVIKFRDICSPSTIKLLECIDDDMSR